MDQLKKQRQHIKKHRLVILVLCFLLFGSLPGKAQCSICSRTTAQMGERPAKALNKGIVYLAVTPLAIFGLIGYRWWKNEKEVLMSESDNDKVR
jgi:hypothetical protein